MNQAAHHVILVMRRDAVLVRDGAGLQKQGFVRIRFHLRVERMNADIVDKMILAAAGKVSGVHAHGDRASLRRCDRAGKVFPLSGSLQRAADACLILCQALTGKTQRGLAGECCRAFFRPERNAIRHVFFQRKFDPAVGVGRKKIYRLHRPFAGFALVAREQRGSPFFKIKILCFIARRIGGHRH